MMVQNTNLATLDKSGLRSRPWSEAEFQKRAREDGIHFPPAILHLAETSSINASTWDRLNSIGDGVMVATWGARQEKFAVEYKPLNTPKAIETAMAQARSWAEKTGLRPLVIAPYLSEANLREMHDAGVSGVDLCGNGVLLAPDFSIWRTASPNRFKSYQPIRNIYRGNSSLFVRALLLKPAFDSLLSFQRFTQERLLARQSELREGEKRLT